MADRIVVMNQGRIEQIGPPLELFDRPANLFVARFIGSPAMNLIETSVSGAADRPALALANGAGLPIPVEQAERLSGRPLVLGVRPEHLSVSVDGEGVPAEVLLVEPTGTETLITLKMGETTLLAAIHERLQIGIGQHLRLAIDPANVHVFDRDTGQRLS